MTPSAHSVEEHNRAASAQAELGPRVALVGNPNTGKSTVFNVLCGTRQKVGNYPGVTVERRTGETRIGNGIVHIVDLPGLYSLRAVSPDERIASDSVTGRLSAEDRPDLILFVMDATNIRRNLFLFSQTLDLELPVVVALTMTDLLNEQGIELDMLELERRLAVPVVAVTARDAGSVGGLLRTLQAALADRHVPAPPVPVPAPGPGNPPARIVYARYEWAATVTQAVERRPSSKRITLSDRVDSVLTHRVLGLIAFGATMYLVFSSIYSWAKPVMDLIGTAFQFAAGFVDEASIAQDMPMLRSLLVDGILGGAGSVVTFLPQIIILFTFVALLEDSGYLARSAFLMDKLLAWTGLNGRSFIPMLSSFACAVPGVMASRVIPDERARLTTVLVSPLMSCSARLPVYLLLIGAFVEPSYGAGWAAFTLFAMHAFGILVALPVAFFLNGGLLKAPSIPFLLELPPYRLPHWRNVVFQVVEAARKFLVRAGTVIFAMSILIWALSYFPRPDTVRIQEEERFGRELIIAGTHPGPAHVQREVAGKSVAAMAPVDRAALTRRIDAAYLEQSYLGRAGRFLEPAFAPLGFDWKITIGILSAFPARETIIATFGIIYASGAGEEDRVALGKRMSDDRRADGRPVFTPLVAASLLIFFALCCQCFSTVATVARELNSWKWATFMFLYMTTLAYVAALLVYQVGIRI